MAGEIGNISDTAFWVAEYRAMETERPDAIFRDNYARLLADERGKEIVNKMPWGKSSAWAMIVRTAVIDEFILRCVQKEGVDTVINLAAGLDARPYRLNLPSSLKWIEVDLPGILTYKEEKLKDAKPVCELRRIKMDLADVDARRKLFDELAASTKSAVVISEGLLVYLTADQVATLSSDLSSHRSFQWWIFDMASPALLKMLQKWFGKKLKEGGVQMQFAPENGSTHFRQFGWEEAEFRSNYLEGIRLNRQMKFAWVWKIMSIFSSKQKQEEFQRAGMALLKNRNS